MLELIMILLLGVGLAAGYFKTKSFVSERLRFVDAVRSPLAPVAAGLGGALVAAPVAWILPAVGAGSALAFGIAVGAGVVTGRREFKRLPGD